MDSRGDRDGICLYLRRADRMEGEASMSQVSKGMDSYGIHSLKRDSRRLLALAAADYAAGIGEAAPVSAPEKGPYGKPFFPQAPWLHFSISHSGAFWVCAMSGQEVGVDVQLRQEKGKRHEGRISARLFHKKEQEYLDSGGDFIDVWCAKESYVKYTGRGIGTDFSAFAVAGAQGLLPCVEKDGAEGQPAAALLRLDPEPAYALCLCAARLGEVHSVWL